MSYLLRVTVPDRPGSLGSLAVALGSVGADIVSLDVVERHDGAAVDDLVVDVPVGTLPDTLITAVERLDGVAVDSLRPFGGQLDAHRELELIDAVALAGADGMQVLTDQAPSVLRVAWALVVSEAVDCGVEARGSSAPTTPVEAMRSVCEVDHARILEPEEVPGSWTAMDTAVAGAPLGGGRVLVVGRPGGPDFRTSEIARLGYLAGILRSLHPGS